MTALTGESSRTSGLFGPGTVTRTVNRELVLLAGGGRALLLQVAHPLVAAGVEQHSDYRHDPWGRLVRTLDLTTKVAFADPQTARRASARVWATHGRVHGTAEDGTPYDARDPALLTWVWATLVDTSLQVFQRAVRPLSADELARYHREQVSLAEAFGVPAGEAPGDPAAFRAYFDGMVARELRVTEAARAVARATLDPPGLAAPLRLPFRALGVVTAGLLPAPVRDDYGFAWSARRARALSAGARGLRAVLPLLPKIAREFPAARGASRAARSGRPRSS